MRIVLNVDPQNFPIEPVRIADIIEADLLFHQTTKNISEYRLGYHGWR